jgi:hypothetical protein
MPGVQQLAHAPADVDVPKCGTETTRLAEDESAYVASGSHGYTVWGVMQEAIVTGRVWAAEAAWGEAGFNDGRPDGNGTSIRLPLGAFKHVVGCVRGPLPSPCCCAQPLLACRQQAQNVMKPSLLQLLPAGCSRRASIACLTLLVWRLCCVPHSPGCCTEGTHIASSIRLPR